MPSSRPGAADLRQTGCSNPEKASQGQARQRTSSRLAANPRDVWLASIALARELLRLSL